jgi:hypothetical protein
MGTKRLWEGFHAVLLASVLASAHAADATPDSLSILKQYPDFAKVVTTTDLKANTATLDVTLCRRKRENCEMFRGDPKSAQGIEDYAYLCAVYENDCMYGRNALVRNSRAAGLIQEAKDKGYGQAILARYGSQYDCAKAKDATACILHHLFRAAGIHRFIVEISGHSTSYLEADEDGTGDLFEG